MDEFSGIFPCEFTIRRMVPTDLESILALYRQGGRDCAWASREILLSLFREGEFRGGFLDGKLVLCCACVPYHSGTPQAAAMRAAIGREYSVQYFLLPPAFAADAACCTAYFLAAVRSGMPANISAAAALPVKTGFSLLSGYFTAGLCAVCMRPLVSLRPHYILLPSARPVPETEHFAIRVPVQDTYAVSRLMEQGFCAFRTEYNVNLPYSPVLYLSRDVFC